MSSFEFLSASAQWVQTHLKEPVHTAVILGSGLGEVVDAFDIQATIPYSDIPHFPKSTVAGHAGKLVLAKSATGKLVAFFQGRFHYYEGHLMTDVIYPVRLAKLLGAQTVIVTNAAGGIHPDFQPGDLMLITDHINMMGTNPLMGANWDELGLRFPDMTEAYSNALREQALQVAQMQGISLKQGVYCGVSGPSYETPAEIRMLRMLGADAVGMSTVPEVIAANHMGLPVLGISCIANSAAGLQAGQRLTHSDVLTAMATAQEKLSQLMQGFIA